MFDLNGKTALITGASKGLGYAMTKGLLDQHCEVIVLGLEQPVGLNIKAFYFIDLSDPVKVEEVISNVLNKERIDILINNAGITIVEDSFDYKLDQYKKTFDINVQAMFLLSRSVAKQMKERKQGKIINIASIQGLLSTYNNAVYVASKHAVVGLTKSFANDWGKFGICTNAIAPGFMITDNTKKYREIPGVIEEVQEKIPLMRWGEPEDLIGPLLFLASDASNYVNGHTLIVDGGFVNL